MIFKPYKINECFEHTFYQIPKELFNNDNYKELNSDSILLYGLLLDRLSVSMKNKWIDEDGNIFLIFTRKEAQEKLRLSDKIVTKAFKQLAEYKLIYEKKLGKRKTNIIYVGKINHIETKEIMSRKNYESLYGNFTSGESENLRCSKNKYNNNKNSNIYTRKKLKPNYEQREYTEEELNNLYCNLEED